MICKLCGKQMNIGNYLDYSIGGYAMTHHICCEGKWQIFTYEKVKR